ncbi:vWA domain-containing protein [Methylotetracoccus oryzae]|uniref:vWA domain-containing protein n=1 Tax=Methylotetracoccus oryzae TaxID=1919059 RepID=UPI001F367DAF|nr:vWA domain-containing protein [Methylotetracoccus oryzae]
MKPQCRWLACAVLVLIAATSLYTAPPAAAAEPLLLPGKKTLYERVLTRPGAKLVASPGAADGKPVVALSRFYVYERQDAGGKQWVKVGGSSRGNTDGWLDAAQTIPWKQQLTLAFTNPANRSRALLFDSHDSVMGLLKAPDAGAKAAELLKSVESGKADPRVVSVEPKEYVDLSKKFYLLPILQAEALSAPANVRVLQVASVTAKPGDASPAEAQKRQQETPAVIRSFSAAVVFVIDTTISMGPYIDRTRDAVRRISAKIEKAGLADQVKFGLIGFRSSTKAVPGLEYVSKVYANPGEVKSGKDFMDKVAGVSAATVSSARFEEDAYAGVMEALRQVHWNDFGGRYVVLITDAGAIDGGDELSETKLGAEQVRIEAAQLGVAVLGLHLKTPAGKANHARAEKQYRTLTQHSQARRPLYYPIESGTVDRFGRQVDTLADTVVQMVQGASRGELVAGSAQSVQSGKPKEADEQIKADALAVGHAMQLAYLGQQKGTQVPDLFTAWLSDRDFAHPELATVDVRVLLTKNELSNLSEAIKLILDKGEESQRNDTADFFNLLRSSAVHIVRDPAKLNDPKAKNLADLGLLGEYLDDLPYKSKVMHLTADEWETWSASARQQEDFLDGLRRKLRHYQIYHDDTDRWIMLDGSSDPGEAVYPVPIDALP